MYYLRRCFAGALFLLSAGAPLQAQRSPTAESSFTMALAGDALITRRLSVYQEPEFQRMIELIRGADAAFLNLEMLFHDYEPWPMYESGGVYAQADPSLVNEIVWAGFDLVSLANNHTGDYGVEGMRLTQRYVREAGLVGAGTGENLPEAREARFLETANGRVALVATTSTFPEHSTASPARGAVRGRPGLSPLRHTSRRIVTADQLGRLEAALRDVGVEVRARDRRLAVFGEVFEAGGPPGVRTEPVEQDVTEIAGVVNNASRLADYTLVSLHAHEGGVATSVPAEFLVTFAHAVIDAGADVVVGHGPHMLRGIEIYRGKLIFYSLGDFMYQTETTLRHPYERYAQAGLDETRGAADYYDATTSNGTRGFPANREVWESVIAMPTFRGRELVGIELHPITLGFGQPRSVRGRPLLADRELGRKIINDLIERSLPFGTVVEWRDGEGIGVVRLPTQPDASQR
jgi:poly-gamma-glutamate synthesis protein (capsule biosynthesis protein)